MLRIVRLQQEKNIQLYQYHWYLNDTNDLPETGLAMAAPHNWRGEFRGVGDDDFDDFRSRGNVSDAWAHR